MDSTSTKIPNREHNPVVQVFLNYSGRTFCFQIPATVFGARSRTHELVLRVSMMPRLVFLTLRTPSEGTLSKSCPQPSPGQHPLGWRPPDASLRSVPYIMTLEAAPLVRCGGAVLSPCYLYSCAASIEPPTRTCSSALSLTHRIFPRSAPRRRRSYQLH